jgi:hypothetical protein
VSVASGQIVALDAKPAALLLAAQVVQLLLDRLCAGGLRGEIGFEFGVRLGQIVALLAQFGLLILGIGLAGIPLGLLFAEIRVRLMQAGILLCKRSVLPGQLLVALAEL